MWMIEIRLLGTFSIKCDNEPVELSSRAAQSLFAYLIITAGTSHRREKLAGMFWPDATEEKARAYLRHELWRIRKAFPVSDFLLSNEIGISFRDSDDLQLDAKHLEQLTDSASAEELMSALSAYQFLRRVGHSGA
jgi:DNA-binding SARP family transcriptional activator